MLPATVPVLRTIRPPKRRAASISEGASCANLRRAQQVAHRGAAADGDALGPELHAEQLVDLAEAHHPVRPLALRANVDDQVRAACDGEHRLAAAVGERRQGAVQVRGNVQFEGRVHREFSCLCPRYTSQPPSTVMAWPVIWRLSSLAMNSTALATSWQVVTRFRHIS